MATEAKKEKRKSRQLIKRAVRELNRAALEHVLNASSVPLIHLFASPSEQYTLLQTVILTNAIGDGCVNLLHELFGAGLPIRPKRQPSIFTLALEFNRRDVVLYLFAEFSDQLTAQDFFWGLNRSHLGIVSSYMQHVSFDINSLIVARFSGISASPRHPLHIWIERRHHAWDWDDEKEIERLLLADKRLDMTMFNSDGATPFAAAVRHRPQLANILLTRQQLTELDLLHWSSKMHCVVNHRLHQRFIVLLLISNKVEKYRLPEEIWQHIFSFNTRTERSQGGVGWFVLFHNW